MITIRTMTTADLTTTMHLSNQARWNQTEADWQRFLVMEPKGCFVAELDGLVRGVTVTCVFQSVAWIAMVLVEASHRRRGVATALMKHALVFLKNQDVKTIRLDATETGKLVYDKLGFSPEYSVTRYGGIAASNKAHPQVLEATPDRLKELIVFDSQAAGTDRTKMLTPLFSESPHGTHVIYQQEKHAGYIMTRSGVHALQIGPCVALPSTGASLLRSTLSNCNGLAVYIDVPSDNIAAVRTVESTGLEVQRHFTRMYHGLPPEGKPCMLWASSGPEKG